jgi:hypothetical protein
MTIHRRDLLKFATATALAGGLPRISRAADDTSVYDVERFGNARILHMTDTHAQLRPVYFREPSVNLGVGTMQGRPAPFSTASISGPIAPMLMRSPVSISKNRLYVMASSVASHTSRP